MARLRRRALAALLALVALAVAGVVAAFITPLPARLTTGDSTLVTWRSGRPAHVFLAEDDRWRVGVDLDEVDPQYVEALVTLEDQRFWTHPGVDPIAIGRAALSNMQHGRVVSGASTITMQLVRVLEPRPRTLRSKVIEALRAMQLELRLSKREILESYLRFTPFGRNIEGVDAASLAYFGHRADALSNAEIATLLAVPQAPNSRYPHPDNAARLRQGRDQIARELLAVGALDQGEGTAPITAEEALAQILAEDVPDTLTPFPREIPHAAFWLRAQHPRERALRTTLDRGTQQTVERLMRERRADYANRDIHNGAAVILDHTTGEVLALVGNFDFRDSEHAGQIPGFATPRSTGSLLKPLVLGLAMDEGMTHPGALVPDVPLERVGWRPENFDGDFNGLVRLDDALARSLNIPFIALTEQLGEDRLLERLRRVGFEHLNDSPGHYGLGVVVGGVEATPLEVAGLYGALANLGQPRPPHVLTGAGEGGAPAAPLISPASSWLVLQALALRERPDMTWRAKLPTEDWVIHWKTGTSNNHRDAWSAGAGGDLTAVVWLGNFSNASSEELVGARVAAPMMFDILEALVDRDAPAPDPPSDLKTIEVCAYSGHLPGPACEHRREVQVPVHGVPMERCPYHRHVEVDAETGERVRPACRAGRETQKISVVYHPPEIAPHLGSRARARAALPQWAEGCQPVSGDGPPRILSPTRGHTVLIIPGIPTDRQRVPLEASADVPGEVSWFIDGEFFGAAPAREKLWWPPSVGEHELVAMDASGRASRRFVTVQTRRSLHRRR